MECWRSVASVQKVSGCEKMKSAKFILKDASSGREVTLSAFEPTLSRIVAGVSGQSLAIKLLMTLSRMYRYNERNVVYSVQEQ